MRRIARLLTVLTPAVAVGLVAAPAHAANPIETARAMLALRTNASFGGSSVTFVADAEFVGGLVPNSAVNIKAVGNEVFTHSTGAILSVPFECHGVTVHFSSSATATCTATLQASDSIVTAVWTAEAVGVSPGVFLGSCAGTANRAGSTEVILPTC